MSVIYDLDLLVMLKENSWDQQLNIIMDSHSSYFHNKVMGGQSYYCRRVHTDEIICGQHCVLMRVIPSDHTHTNTHTHRLSFKLNTRNRED